MTAGAGPNPEPGTSGRCRRIGRPRPAARGCRPRLCALRRSRRRSVMVSLVLVAIAATLTVIMLVDPLQPWVQPFDDWWYRWIADHRTPWLTRVAEVLAVVGSGWVTFPLRLAIAALLAFRRRWTQLSAFVTAIVVSEFFIGPLKAIVGRPRPPRSLVELDAPRRSRPVTPSRRPSPPSASWWRSCLGVDAGSRGSAVPASSRRRWPGRAPTWPPTGPPTRSRASASGSPPRCCARWRSNPPGPSSPSTWHPQIRRSPTPRVTPEPEPDTSRSADAAVRDTGWAPMPTRPRQATARMSTRAAGAVGRGPGRSTPNEYDSALSGRSTTKVMRPSAPAVTTSLAT